MILNGILGRDFAALVRGGGLVFPSFRLACMQSGRETQFLPSQWPSFVWFVSGRD